MFVSVLLLFGVGMVWGMDRKLSGSGRVGRASRGHRLLLLAMSRARAGSVLDVAVVMYVFPQFVQPYLVRRGVLPLVNAGLLCEVDGGWSITDAGVQVLRDVTCEPYVSS